MLGADVPLPAIERLVESATGTRAPLELREIAGGGSVRRFFRVATRSRGSLVAMYVPVPSHELTKPPTRDQTASFLEVRALLELHGVRVPALVGEDRGAGLILVEDLGETLARHLGEHPADREQLYQSALRDLARAQQRLWPLPPGSIVATRAFDEELLRWEVEHFREWALDARGIALTPSESASFERAAQYLARTIASWPRGFVHRDYQSRNLMVVPAQDGSLALGWIDFQDAMLGPRIYDVVALLSDSYQSFTPEFIERRLDEFALHLGLDARERALLGREFRLVTVQRKLKDAGRFVFFERRQHNPDFLRFVEPSIAKVRHALAELTDEPELAGLATLLTRITESPARVNSAAP